MTRTVPQSREALIVCALSSDIKKVSTVGCEGLTRRVPRADSRKDPWAGQLIRSLLGCLSSQTSERKLTTQRLANGGNNKDRDRDGDGVTHCLHRAQGHKESS